ncbi:MAG: DUF4139 domain-containing protein [Deltaproteobacteria bacterium]|nr:DUF4139 domain-containing protein [Deltaproteobacteria bacterium]
MMKTSRYIFFLSALILVLAHPCRLWAAPHEVILFPHAAYITEDSKIRLQPANHDQKKAVFLLPAEADPASLVCGFAQTTTMRIEGLSWRQIIPDNDETIKALRSRLKKGQEEKNDLLAHIKSLDAQIQFWQAQAKGKAKSNAEAVGTVAAVGRNLKALYREKFMKEAEAEKTDKVIADCLDETGRYETGKGVLWEITLLISGAQTGEAVFRYSYLVGDCGWTPHYRIEAETPLSQVTVKEQVRIEQNTGANWNRVAVRIASRMPVLASALPDSRAHSTPPSQNPATEQKAAGRSKSLRALPQPANDHKGAGDAVKNEAYGTGAFCTDLGVMDLPSQSVRTITMKSDVLSAGFVFLLKPLNPLAVIKASLHPPFTGRFPDAEALFLIDGAVVAKGIFPIANPAEDIYFGIDPQVTVDRRPINKSAGTASTDGSDDRQNFLMEIKNTKKTAVTVVVEEPLTSSLNGTEASGHFDPQPTEQNSEKAVWKFELSPGGKKSLSVCSKKGCS